MPGFAGVGDDEGNTGLQSTVELGGLASQFCTRASASLWMVGPVSALQPGVCMQSLTLSSLECSELSEGQGSLLCLSEEREEVPISFLINSFSQLLMSRLPATSTHLRGNLISIRPPHNSQLELNTKDSTFTTLTVTSTDPGPCHSDRRVTRSGWVRTMHTQPNQQVSHASAPEDKGGPMCALSPTLDSFAMPHSPFCSPFAA